MANTWNEFFDNHAKNYDSNPWVGHEIEEVEFLIDLLGIKPGDKILDLGCGTGRHIIEFAKRGFIMTGIDISSNMLDIAKQKASNEKVDIEFLQADISEIEYGNEKYDAVICLCEGGFSLLGKQDDHIERELTILCNAQKCLKATGKFVVTAPNALLQMKLFFDTKTNTETFDPITQVDLLTLSEKHNDRPRVYRLRERSFMPNEIILLLKLAGFKNISIKNGTAGFMHKNEIVSDNSIEILAFGEK